MRRLVYFVLFFWCGVIYSQSLGFLEDISRPLSFAVFGNHLFVLEGSVVKVYDRKNLNMTETIGREGEGPGEIKTTPFYRNSMRIINGQIFVDSVDKLLYFSPRGKLLREIKKRTFLTTRMLPVGDNFVVKSLDRTDGRKEFIVITLYNKKMEKMKELYRQISPIQPSSSQMIPDSVYFSVIGNNIYIDNSPKGFQIMVFDEAGKTLSLISNDAVNRAVTSAVKEQVMAEYKNDPLIKRIGFENLKKNVDFIFPSHFPAITGLEAAEGNLIVKTPHTKEGSEIFHILTGDGKLKKEVVLPHLSSDSGLDKNNAIDEQLVTIGNKVLLCLRENENEEQWELLRYSLTN